MNETRCIIRIRVRVAERVAVEALYEPNYVSIRVRESVYVCVCVCVSHSSSSIHWPLHVQHSSSARRVIVACFYQHIQYVCLAPPLMHRHFVALRVSQQLCFRRAAWGLANGLLGLRIQATP